MKIGFEIKPGFSFSAANNPANYKLMLLVDAFFINIGSILVLNHNNMLEYKVQGFKNCLKIKAHFLTYPLLTYKLVYFKLWCSMLNIIENKSHLTMKGLFQLVVIKASFPKGLTSILIDKFPSIQPIALPSYLPDLTNINYFWLCGFITCDGSFFISVQKSITPVISIAQDIKSIILMKGILDFLGFGTMAPSRIKVQEIRITKLSDVITFITNLQPHGLYGAKYLDFMDFCKVIEKIKNTEHLTTEGKIQIKNIVKGMNQRRTYF